MGAACQSQQGEIGRLGSQFSSGLELAYDSSEVDMENEELAAFGILPALIL